MRSMFGMGFDRQIFTERHPSMGVSFNEVQDWWKTNYPRIKESIAPLREGALPGTVPIAAPRPAIVPAPSSGTSTALVIGGLAVAGLAGYWFLSKKPFGIRK